MGDISSVPGTNSPKSSLFEEVNFPKSSIFEEVNFPKISNYSLFGDEVFELSIG